MVAQGIESGAGFIIKGYVEGLEFVHILEHTYLSILYNSFILKYLFIIIIINIIFRQVASLHCTYTE